MPEKQKTLEELRAEKEQAEARLLQEQHKLNRLKNRLHYYEQGARAKRTHRLCNLGGAVESLAPQVKTFRPIEPNGKWGGKVQNLKEMGQAFRYLQENGIHTLEDLQGQVESHNSIVEHMKKTGQRNRSHERDPQLV